MIRGIRSVLLRKERRLRGEGYVQTGSEWTGMSNNHGMPRMTCGNPKLAESSPSEPQGGTNPVTLWFLTSGLQNRERMKCLLFEATYFISICYSNLGKEIETMGAESLMSSLVGNMS